MNLPKSNMSQNLRQYLSIDELRARAKKSVPLPTFNHIDGGPDDEVTLGIT